MEDNAGGQLGKFPQMDFLKMCCVVVMMGGCLLTERTAAGQRSTGRRRDDRYAMPRARLTTTEWRGLNAMQDDDDERNVGKMGGGGRSTVR